MASKEIKVNGKKVSVTIYTVKHKTLVDGNWVTEEEPIRQVLVEDEAKDRIFLWGELEYVSDQVIFFRRTDWADWRVHTIMAYVIDAILDNYLKNRETMEWELWK